MQSYKAREQAQKQTMFERAMYGPIKARKPKISTNTNNTVANVKLDLSIKGFESSKTNKPIEDARTKAKRRSANMTQSSYRTNQTRKKIVDNKIKKNLSIGDINYDSLNYATGTSKASKRPKLSTGVGYAKPGSTKNASKPTTATNSLSKGGVMYNPIAKPGAYASRRGRKISDLNKSIGSKYSKGTPSNQSSTSKREMVIEDQNRDPSEPSSGQFNLKINTSNHIKKASNLQEYNLVLEEKYLESSKAKEGSNIVDSEQWHEEQFENLTSSSMSSLASVPDEYTFVQNTSKESNDHKYYKCEVELRNPKDAPKPEIIDTKEDDGNFETEMENEETRSSGLDQKYVVNVPSMITHLKRKDTYMESLDIFLNENLKAIADLIKIKKEVTTELEEYNEEIKSEKRQVERAEKKTKLLERDISHTLEENY